MRLDTLKYYIYYRIYKLLHTKFRKSIIALYLGWAFSIKAQKKFDKLRKVSCSKPKNLTVDEMLKTIGSNE